MNLEQSDSFKNELERNARSKRNVVISLVFCSFLIVLLVILIGFVRYQDSITEKMFIDDVQIGIPAGLYKVIDGDRYVNIRTLAELFGYNYTKGIYGEYTEDDDSCYLQNNFEIVAITAGAQKYTKYLEMKDPAQATIGPITGIRFKNENGYSESFKLEKPVRFEDGNLYVLQEYVPTMFNIQIDWQEYRIRFYTLNYLASVAQRTAAGRGLTHIQEYYENMRALNYGYIVVGDATSGIISKEYGVIDLSTGQEIISTKYDDIVFVENSQEFNITVANGTVGILNNKGETVIAPSEFEKISLLDQENKLYLVEKNREYGILDKNGDILIYAEYDEIGIDIADFIKEETDNGKLLFGKCIPVKKDNKYGLYDIEGNKLLESVYDGFGYKTPVKTTSSGSEQSALLIPSYVGINGIVVNYNDKYGIFDVNAGALILPTVFDKVYSVKKEGERTYYVSYNEEELELSQYLKEMNLNNVNENGEVLTEKPDVKTELNEINENTELNKNVESNEIDENTGF
ncbi:MAG: WG repeat-containing protein [Clostridia bacterium]|nr:WG repeat-containing protein [Clostridia bacterium]